MPEPDAPEPILDHAHLDVQTFGDNALARELLILFAEQCRRLAPAIRGLTDIMSQADAAHTLKGAAAAVGAGRVAALSGAIETALSRRDGASAIRLGTALDEAVDDVQAAIAGYLAET
jgi:HPt (histidine-containing phosphotransfer) domain-containing protein